MRAGRLAVRIITNRHFTSNVYVTCSSSECRVSPGDSYCARVGASGYSRYTRRRKETFSQMKGNAMPYVDIKCFPRNEEMRKDIVEKINQVLIDAWGCPQEAISISLEEVTPENWDAQVKVPEMDVRDETMYILHGEKRF